jgi:type VI secretion system protein VasJ
MTTQRSALFGLIAMASFDETAIIDLGTRPIPGDRPCGADAVEDEGYILVQAEAAKLDRIEAGEPDWHQIEQAATEILRSKAKDVEVASILGVALFKRYGYAGLAASLKLLTELTTTFWDGCFPARPRRRRARIEALAERFTDGGWFRDHQPNANDFDAIDACAGRIEELDAALKSRMPDEPPDFAKFIRGIRELAARRPQAASGAPTETGSAPPPAGAQPSAAFSAGEVADASGAISAMLDAAAFLRKADPTDPLAYAIVRVLKWTRVALPASDAGKSQIQPPEPATIETLAHQFNNGLWENLLKNAEAAFRSNDPLWLDLQRYVCTAMSRLGTNYDRARQAVVGLTANLVHRLGEGLYEIQFRTGMPLCSGETRIWIESEAAPPQQRSGLPPVGRSDGKLAESMNKARRLAGEGKVREAMEGLREGLVACTERRDRFLWRLAMARLCFDSQRLQLAAPLLEECHGEIQRYHIDEWEPSLAIEVAQALYRCRKALMTSEKEPTPEALQGVRDSFAWLCQLDPLAALAAEPSGV